MTGYVLVAVGFGTVLYFTNDCSLAGTLLLQLCVVQVDAKAGKRRYFSLPMNSGQTPAYRNHIAFVWLSSLV